MRKYAGKITRYIRPDTMLIKCFEKYPVQGRVMHMMHVRKKMVRYMVIETSENKVGRLAERIKIIGAFYLIHQP